MESWLDFIADLLPVPLAAAPAEPGAALQRQTCSSAIRLHAHMPPGPSRYLVVASTAVVLLMRTAGNAIYMILACKI